MDSGVDNLSGFDFAEDFYLLADHFIKSCSKTLDNTNLFSSFFCGNLFLMKRSAASSENIDFEGNYQDHAIDNDISDSSFIELMEELLDESVLDDQHDAAIQILEINIDDHQNDIDWEIVPYDDDAIYLEDSRMKRSHLAARG